MVADLMGKPGLRLEADRARLCDEMLPPLAWHEHNAVGTAKTWGFGKFISLKTPDH